MGAQLDRLRYEVFQNLFYSPMNTGILRAAVATAPTVYGIETDDLRRSLWIVMGCNSTYRLRYWNYLGEAPLMRASSLKVATAPTVYGIETKF